MSQSFSSLSSVFVQIGGNDTKTLVWMKLFCSVFAEMKTITFENTLKWIGPKSQDASVTITVQLNLLKTSKLSCVDLQIKTHFDFERLTE